LGSALNFKPILEVTNGVFEGLERVRTRVKALNRLADLVVDRINGREPVYLGILHCKAPEIAEELLKRMNEKVTIAQSLITELGPAVGVHLGPGTVGVTFMAGIK